MALNFRRIFNGLQIKVRPSTVADTLGELEVVGTKLSFHNGTTVSPLVTEAHASQGANRLQNKDLEAASTALVDGSDTTKKVKIDPSGATTGKTMTVVSSHTDNRSLTLPDTTDTLVGKATTDTLTNKTLVDSSTAIADNVDNTKQIKFDAAGTTGTSTTLTSSQTTNKVLTLPDATDTLVGKATTDTLTNKTLIDNSTAIADNSDNTKQIKFDASGTTGTSSTITSSQTSNRVLTLPDATTTLVGTDTIQDITAKTLLEVDNLQLNGNTIASINTNGNITLSPNGTGIVDVTKDLNITKTLRTTQSVDSSTTGADNDLALPTVSFTTFTNASLTSIRSIAAGANGQYFVLKNNSGANVVLKNEDAGATAANRITTGIGSNITLLPGSSVKLVYDSNASRWSIVSSPGSFTNQSANSVFAGPASGAAASPSFRSLVVADTTIAAQSISSTNIDWSTGSVFTKTLGANTTFTFSGAISGQTIVVRLTNTASNYTVTWPTVSWKDSSVPTMSPGAVSDVYTFVYDGTKYYGNVIPNFDGTGSSLSFSQITGTTTVAQTTISTQAISASNIDWSTGSTFSKTLGANTTLTFSNAISGQTIVIRLTNTASNYTVAWPTIRWAGGTAPTMTTGAKSDVYTIFYDGSNYYGSAVQNMS